MNAKLANDRFGSIPLKNSVYVQKQMPPRNNDSKPTKILNQYYLPKPHGDRKFREFLALGVFQRNRSIDDHLDAVSLRRLCDP